MLVRAWLALTRRIGRFVGNRCHPAVAQFARDCVTAFRYGLENVNFDLERNGERWLLEQINEVARERVVLFDVGANIGQWTTMALTIFRNCEVHAFEVVPETFLVLRENTRDLPNIVLNDVGLGEQEGFIDIYCSSYGNDISTAFPIASMQEHMAYDHKVRGRIVRGIDYLQEKQIHRIDLLKIDVEGMDLRVLRGFEDRLSSVRAIQFEYGVFNIQSRDLLQDFFLYLGDHHFRVGKLYPRGVRFTDYHFLFEDFLGNNYVAVSESESALIQRLAIKCYAS